MLVFRHGIEHRHFDYAYSVGGFGEQKPARTLLTSSRSVVLFFSSVLFTPDCLLAPKYFWSTFLRMAGRQPDSGRLGPGNRFLSPVRREGSPGRQANEREGRSGLQWRGRRASFGWRIRFRHTPLKTRCSCCASPPLATLPPWDVYLGERKGGFLEQPGRKRVGSANAKRAWKNSCRAIIRLRMRGS